MLLYIFINSGCHESGRAKEWNAANNLIPSATTPDCKWGRIIWQRIK
jgi:hypothetical protein